MRVAYFVHAFPSWSETFVSNQITGLQERGHDVEVFAQHAETPPQGVEAGRSNLRVPVHYRPPFPERRLARALRALDPLLRGLRRNPRATLDALNTGRHGRLAGSLELLFSAVPLLPRRSFDVVHCHFGPNGILAAALREAGFLAGPIVTTFHAYDLTKYLQKWGPHLYDRLLVQGDLFLVISEHWRRRLLALGAAEDKTRVHHMGVDCEQRFVPRQPSAADRVPRLLSVGRLVEKKGFEYGIRAVAALRHSGRRCEYTIIGDGPLRTDLAALIAQLDVADAVRLAGRQDQAGVWEQLRASDILIAPSVTGSDGDQEGIPVALMEAMAMGLSVVSTRHSGIPELVIAGESGYLVDERDVTALRDRLITLLDDPAQRQAMGNAGRRTVAEAFNIRRLNDRLVERFEQLIAEAGRR